MIIETLLKGKDISYETHIIDRIIPLETLNLPIDLPASYRKRKNCQNNSIQTATRLNCQVVVGEILIEGNVPTNHVWNYIDGIHFDVTVNDTYKHKYIMYFMSSINELEEKGYKFDAVKDLQTQYIIKLLEKE